jgi:hypothetical protein
MFLLVNRADSIQIDPIRRETPGLPAQSGLKLQADAGSNLVIERGRSSLTEPEFITTDFLSEI